MNIVRRCRVFCGGVILMLLSLCHVVNAQAQINAESKDEVASVPSAFSALSQLRADADKVYTQEIADCYQVFAVNPCLNKARQKYAASSAAIKRQEIALHDAERQRNATQQRKKLEEKSSPQNQQAATEQRENRAAEAKEKQLAAAEKALEKSKSAGITTVRSRNKAPKSAPQARDPKLAHPPKQGSAQKALDFEQKQKEAASRQAGVEKARRERTKPLSVPLPAAGAPPTPLPPRLATP